MSEDSGSDLRGRIDALEEAYEFMLAYAAQGRDREDESEDGGIRSFLTNADEALVGLHDIVRERAESDVAEADRWKAFIEILRADAERARTLITFALAQPVLSSELIDNLNATNHVRTILTDIFLLDSAFDAHRDA